MKAGCLNPQDCGLVELRDLESLNVGSEEVQASCHLVGHT
jgi:hypothetical protein